MARIVGEGGVQEGVDDLQSQSLAGDPCAQRQDVGVVVLAGGLGGEAVPAQGAADAGDLVGGNGHADAGAADEDAALALPGSDGLRHRFGVNGIVAGIVGISSDVLHSVSLFLKVSLKMLLEIVSAVITTDCNFHLCFLPLGTRGLKKSVPESFTESAFRKIFNKDDVNVFDTSNSTKVEMPFEWNITLANGLWWIIDKSINDHDLEIPKYIKINPEKIILLEE